MADAVRTRERTETPCSAGRLLARHAERAPAESRPALPWLDRFRTVLAAAFRDRELLRTTELPLRSVADRVGYADVRALRREVRGGAGRAPG
ncbi:hypothetical protein [Streptomyces sp. 2P-4]|uniref:hypothetical protein n=1 Tax=Streptomyces sp. 2P-4 TaxID=2931974 RepID=UPI00253FA51B|nr:hypothetical protein [Streptomyces sp. 2P-4]